MDKNELLPVSGVTSDGSVVSIEEVELGFLTQLAGWDHFNKVADNGLRAQGLTLPNDYRTPFRDGSTTVWRIAPDRILVRSDRSFGFENSDDLVVLELSDARVCLTIEGPGAEGLLSRVMALDFADAAFPVGSFAQAGLHHVGVLVDRHGRDQFTLLIPTSWATSLTRLLAEHLAKVA